MLTPSPELGIYIFRAALACIIFYEILMYVRGKSSEKWLARSAKVLDLGITIQDNDGTEESKAFIKYVYSYHGREYRGSRIAYGDIWSTNYDDASNDIRGIIKGDEITVYINPKSPGLSTLKRGYRGHFLWKVFILVVILIVLLKF